MVQYVWNQKMVLNQVLLKYKATEYHLRNRESLLGTNYSSSVIHFSYHPISSI